MVFDECYEESQNGRSWKEGMRSLRDVSQPCPKSKSKSWFSHRNSPKDQRKILPLAQPPRGTNFTLILKQIVAISWEFPNVLFAITNYARNPTSEYKPHLFEIRKKTLF